MICTFSINQSPDLDNSIATSSTVTFSLVSTNVTDRSNNSDKTVISLVLGSNLRILSKPVIITCPLLIDVTRVIGTKIRLRGGTSTINPKILGGWLLERRVATASLTFPTWSPFGSNTPVPANRARNTRFRLEPLVVFMR
ncbi:unannotated protein [freshwater metagenome]|uniref:Unannotated protein n=1 Tax=freshwater metagenome TaxID=449393 RepID=A0A6J7DG52_9ZZZZ